jgi:polysaccharide export outer membrane protein
VRPDGTIALGFFGNIQVRGLTLEQIKVKIILHMRKYILDEVLGMIEVETDGEITAVPPEESSKVYVDVDSCNSKSYHVEGDVALPGRYPCTGKETVLDALEFAGGLLPTADPKDIQLVRPARGGKPARLYRIDWEAVLKRGDAKANLQLFPADRIVVERHPLVKSTAQFSRVAEPFSLMLNQMIAYYYALRAAQNIINPDGSPLTPTQREAVLKDWADSWQKVAPEGASIDMNAVREVLLNRISPPAQKPDVPK